MKNLKYILSLILLTMSIHGYCQQMYDRSGSYIGYINGNNVYNRSGSLIGRVNRVPDLIVALVYFYGYFPLR